MAEPDCASDFVAGGFHRDNIVARCALHGLVDRDIGDHRQQTAGHHQLLAADAVGERAHYGEERHSEQKGDGDDNVRGLYIDFQNGLHIEQA
jgi:hypothetical protein